MDLRSDFLTRPTPEMIEAMMAAAQQRGGFGVREDPYVQELEALAAHMVGKEDALFCASCGLANQIAIHLQCGRGSTLLAESSSHVFTSEAGGPAALSGVMCKGVAGHEGVPDFDAVDQALVAGDAQRSGVDLLVIENTHVRTGGAVVDMPTLQRLRGLAQQRGVPVHLDGSRVFNAAAALDVSAAEICANVDSVAFSLNKGLAAPLGAILAGPAEFIEEAVRVRQMFGGGWRPAGIPAAAATVALQTMPQRLAHDHAVAADLGAALAGLEGLSLGQSRVWTNLVLVDLGDALGTAAGFAEALARQGVLALPFGKRRLRLAVYYEIGPEDIPFIVDAFRKVIVEFI
ncbi:MAG: GntG family PLP-dependent aldolase [Burkholderiaceae bacterium]